MYRIRREREDRIAMHRDGRGHYICGPPSVALDQAPEEAWVVRGDTDVKVAASELKPGDIVRIRPGERLPADGAIIAGASSLQQAAITGESMPIEKAEGDEVFAGTLNGAGALLVRVTKPASPAAFSNDGDASITSRMCRA